ncbi:MAG: hypothetical protein AUK48_08885 [Oscillatoriales cyanobacterium CG2_30_44_21]|nr:MAG: hypothetical protein AUK48_08885 [Oscillatoriales cyanobacterium CG2_30_44_21]
MALIGSDENKIQRAKTRVLLVLWALAGVDNTLGKGKILPLTRTKEKSADYDEIFAALEADGAIALTRLKNDKIKNATLTQVGYGLLGEYLRSPDFEFEGTQIGAKMGNYLVKWIAHVPNAPVVAESAPKIASYDEFKAVALETYDQLNRDYNLSNLVPIYRIRRAIGESVTRSQFSDWLLEMQSNEIVQLQGGGVEDDAPDKLEDSILTKVSGLRCYAKKLAI